MLEAGHPLILATTPVEGSAARVSVSYANLPRNVDEGHVLFLADGTIQLRVERVTESEIHCRVLVGGPLSSRKGVNVPSGLSGLPILGERDLQDLRFGLERGVDYIALSFVRSVEDVAAPDGFDAMADAADGIMIARGDLALQTPFARVPVVQKQLIARANQRATPIITATQMLYSMVSSPQPTRAEVTDVANAILDGSDAVSGQVPWPPADPRSHQRPRDLSTTCRRPRRSADPPSRAGAGPSSSSSPYDAWFTNADGEASGPSW